MCGSLTVVALCLYVRGVGISACYGGVDNVDKCVDKLWMVCGELSFNDNFN